MEPFGFGILTHIVNSLEARVLEIQCASARTDADWRLNPGIILKSNCGNSQVDAKCVGFNCPCLWLVLHLTMADLALMGGWFLCRTWTAFIFLARISASRWRLCPAR